MGHNKGVELRFQPKGSMCAACRHKDRDCSHLNFVAMLPILEWYTDASSGEPVRTAVVKCTEFERLQ